MTFISANCQTWLIGFFLLAKSVESYDLGYTESSLYNCKIDQDYTQQQKMDILQLYPIDAFVFVILGPVSFAASLLIIFIFLKFPQARIIPGDLLLGLSICDLIQSIHYMMQGWYLVLHDKSPLPLDPFCQINGMISVSMGIGDYMYNMCFVISPLVLVSNTLTQKSFIFKSILHVFIFIVILGITIDARLDHRIYLNLSGLCAVSEQNKSEKTGPTIIFLCFLFLYVVVAMYAIYKFKRTVPKNSKLREVRAKYLVYYKTFVTATAILWALQLIFGVLNNLNCFVFQDPALNVTLTCFNIISIITPIIQAYIRTSDPLIRSKIKRLLYQVYPAVSDESQQDSEQPSRTQSRYVSEPNFLQEIQREIRTTQVYTLLVGVVMMITQQNQQELECSKSILEDEEDYNNNGITRQHRISDHFDVGFKTTNFSKQDAEEHATLNLTDEIVRRDLPGDHQFSVFNSRMTFYSPKLFKYFTDKDYPMINLLDSLCPFKNHERIQAFGGPDGGKSGEFFFFSHDSRIIIKTMTQDEVVSMRKRLLIYGNYLYNNPDSMISKIYGVFTFTRTDKDLEGLKVHILIQRNISFGFYQQYYLHFYKSIPRKYILRTFDMKGSEFDREVLNKKGINTDASKLTLKDIDFLKTERKIWIKPFLSEIMVNSLIEDAKFFKQARLIDYSLLVFKADWAQYFADTGVTFKQMKEQITNSLYMVESTREKGIYYHIAIIDFLQEWNANKSAEQLTKKLIKFDANLDTSSQNPDVYSERFYKKLVERILLQSEEDLEEISQVQKEWQREDEDRKRKLEKTQSKLREANIELTSQVKEEKQHTFEIEIAQNTVDSSRAEQEELIDN